MKTRIIHLLLVLLIGVSASWSQHDFSVRWNVHTTGDAVEEDPFNGSFTITNVGTTTIPLGDTLWYGYLVDGEKHDLSLDIDAVSGEVLDADFAPEEEITVINNFFWPLIWESGATIEICATVYGVTYASHTGELFTGDIDTLNNRACLYAILPIYAAGIDDDENEAELAVYFNEQNEIVFTNYSNESIPVSTYSVFNSFGQVVFTSSGDIPVGETSFSVGNISAGFYMVHLSINDSQRTFKFIVD